MRFFVILALAITVAVFSQSAPSLAQGVQVTQLLVKKADRKLYLLNGRSVLRSYDVDLGWNPVNHKVREGDGRTPEGLYHITHRNPQSTYYLSLGISYPNAEDRARARRRGVSPGGDIFVHGQGPSGRGRGADWTAGCIAVTDAEMREIYSLVKPGTPIFIAP